MKDDKIYIQHILDAIDKINKFVKDVSYEQFITNDMMFGAVVREMQIIGEAAKLLSDDFKQNESSVPGGAITGFRNRAVHEYFDVNLQTVWETIEIDLPKLKESLQKYL